MVHYTPSMNRMTFQPGPLADRLGTALEAAAAEDVVERIWRRDPALWKADAAAAKIITNSLGWLTVAEDMSAVADQLIEFAGAMRDRGFRHVMVCGMGGSSLCPEVLARTFGRQAGFPELLVLDSTDPDVVADLKQRISIEHCLFVIASKSGSTTEPNVFYKYWYDEVSKLSENPGENFIAITDPGSPLVDTATEQKFQRVFLNQPDIGGRYSALSYFGMVPAALMGLDVRKLLERAQDAKSLAESYGLELGTILGEAAATNRDKLTLILDQRIETLGLWIEQLIAESTGKKGKGIVPVNGESLGPPESYGSDRLFVSISMEAPLDHARSKLEALAAAGHPLVLRELGDLYDLGAEFFLWEFATAVAGWRLEINPFDQPNVQEAKDATKELLERFSRHGRLEELDAIAADDLITIYGDDRLKADSVAGVLKAHLESTKPGDYIAFLNYVEETPQIDEQFKEIRDRLHEAKKCAVTIGYGPRFLHSTGQLHKGGPDTGVFFQIVAADQEDFAIPGENYTFSILKQAQALGDYHALARRGRRVIGISLAKDTLAALSRLKALVNPPK